MDNQELLIASTESGGQTEEPKLRRFLKQGIGLAVAVIFLFLAFKDCDREKLFSYMQGLDYGFVILSVLASVLSHVVRAWRWNVLLAPIAQHKVSLLNSFSAVVYSYVVNLLIPRGGEVARLVSISRSEKLHWAGVLPTLLIDRLLDVAMLVLLLGITLTSLPTAGINLPWLNQAGILMCVLTVSGLVTLPFTGRIVRFIKSLIGQKIPSSLAEKIEILSRQFDLGTKCLTNPLKLPEILFQSLLMWILYFATLYTMVYAFHIETKVSLSQALVVFTVSSVGVLVPTPGSVGSYHYLASVTLQKLAGLSSEHALAFATVIHLCTFILSCILPAAICALLQGSSRAAEKEIIS